MYQNEDGDEDTIGCHGTTKVAQLRHWNDVQYVDRFRSALEGFFVRRIVGKVPA